MGLVQGGAGVFFVHRQLLAVGGGEGIAAVGVDAHGPDVGLGITGELAIGQGHVGALVIEAGVLRGQGLAVGGVEYHHLVAVGYGGNDAAFLDFEECLGKQSFIAADGAEGTPVVLLGIPLQIAAAAHVLNIVAALGGSLLQCPGGVGLVQGSAGVFFVHGQLLAVGGGEGIAAIVVDAHGPDVGLGEARQLAAGEGHVGALVIEAGVLAGQGLQVCGVVDDHLVAVLQRSGGIDDAAFPGGDGAELIQGHGLLILALIIAEPGAVGGGCVILQRGVVAGDLHITISKGDGVELRSGAGDDLVAAGLAGNVLSAGGLYGPAAGHGRDGERVLGVITNDLAVGDGHVHLVALLVQGGQGAVHDQAALFIDDQVLTGPVLLCLGDLFPGPGRRLCREYRHRQQGNQHDQ